MDDVMQSEPATLACAGPGCRSRLAPEQDWYQLDGPEVAMHAFCSLKCLSRWCAYHASSGFELVRRSATREPA